MTAGKHQILNPDRFVELKEFLDEKHLQYNNKGFILGDPISVPHLFSEHTDIEISGFLTATISWGRRESIARAGKHLMSLMGSQPADFIKNASGHEIRSLSNFVYRTFNGFDAQVFVYSLRNLLNDHGTLENAFFDPIPAQGMDIAFIISRFKRRFFGNVDPGRSGKHISDPLKNSAAKRINMLLRWMVRNDHNGVDFGIWKKSPPSSLVCPLDLHSGRVARTLGLLNRRQNDWKATVELTENLQKLDPADPVKYDFALFGLGWYEKF
jgi:uncharacterized protein (TIGR02757 family)